MTLAAEYFSTIAILSATVILLYLFYRSRSNRKYPPSLPWLPVVGSLPLLGSFNKLPQTLMEKAATLGNVFTLYDGSKYILVLTSIEAIHEAFVKKGSDFAGRTHSLLIKKFKTREKSLGISLRQYDDSFKHIRHQTISILKDFGAGKRIIEQRIIVEVAQFIEFAKERNGEDFNYHESLSCCTVNVIHSIMFGKRLDPFGSKIKKLIQDASDLLLNAIPELDFMPVLKVLPSYKRRILHLMPCAQKYREDLEASIDEALREDNEDECFVRNFVDGGSQRSELTSLMVDLVTAGFDPSTTFLEWSFILLANHPEVQLRLHQEIDSVVPRDRLPSLDDKSKLPYVEAAILEVMRYKTPSTFAVLHRTLCDTEVQGYFIPKDTQVLANLHGAHMDPKAWSEPTAFRPERFLDNDGHVIGKDMVISFSLGKRACTGEQLGRQQVFLFFAGILQQFEIRPPHGQTVVSYKEKLLASSVVPTSFKVCLIPRSH